MTGKGEKARKRAKKGMALVRASPKRRVNRQEKQLNVKIAKQLKVANELSENLGNLDAQEPAAKRPRASAAPKQQQAVEATPEKLMVVPPNNKGGITLTRKDERFSKAADALSKNLKDLGRDEGKGKGKGKKKAGGKGKGVAAKRAQVVLAEGDDDDDDNDDESASVGAAPAPASAAPAGVVPDDDVDALIRGICGGRRRR